MVNTAMLESCPWCFFFFFFFSCFLVIPVFHACFAPLHPPTVKSPISAVGKRCQEHDSWSLHLNKIHSSCDRQCWIWKPLWQHLSQPLWLQWYKFYCFCLKTAGATVCTLPVPLPVLYVLAGDQHWSDNMLKTPCTMRSSSGTKDCVITYFWRFLLISVLTNINGLLKTSNIYRYFK